MFKQENGLGGGLKRKASFDPDRIPNKAVELSRLVDYEIVRKLGYSKFGIVNIIKDKRTNGIFIMKRS